MLSRARAGARARKMVILIRYHIEMILYCPCLSIALQVPFIFLQVAALAKHIHT
jgi:hypothetical protein